MDIKIVSTWSELGFSEDEEIQWKSVVQSPIEARKWIEAGFKLKDVQKWKLLNVELPEARKFRQLGLEPEQIKRWISAGFKTADEIISWANLEFGIEDSKLLKQKGFNAKQVGMLIDRGVDKEKILQIVKSQKKDELKELIAMTEQLLLSDDSALLDELKKAVKNACIKYRDLYNITDMIEEYEKSRDKEILEKVYDDILDIWLINKEV